MATLSQYMLSSAATFSFFLAIGSVRSFICSHFNQLTMDDPQVIRTDGPMLVPPHLQAALTMSPAVIRSKYEGARMMRERWDAEKKRDGGR
jgi:hypothetical protein